MSKIQKLGTVGREIDISGRPEKRRTYALWKNALNKLLTNPRFTYGFEIPFEFLETNMTVERNEPYFAFGVIALKQALKLHGFLLTQRGMSDRGLRVAMREEMWQIVYSQELSKAKHTMMNHLCLSAVDTKRMKDADVDKLHQWRDNAALIAQRSLGILGKKKLFAQLQQA